MRNFFLKVSIILKLKDMNIKFKIKNIKNVIVKIFGNTGKSRDPEEKNKILLNDENIN